MFEIAKNMIAKNFNGYIIIIVVMNIDKDFSIAKFFSSRFRGIFANIFQCKIIQSAVLHLLTFHIISNKIKKHEEHSVTIQMES